MSDDRQGGLFDEPDMSGWEPERITRYEQMRRQWAAFHDANPDVYLELRRIALALVRRGRRRYGIGGIFEVLRWQRAMNTTDTDFKLNNNYRAFYARFLMNQEPELAGFFEVREQISAGPDVLTHRSIFVPSELHLGPAGSCRKCAPYTMEGDHGAAY